ncbi:nucleotidyltransferase family protein [Ancylobacter sp.]|uniref:nucleotidyltransferase family protein n=1 Tax=Ancylobacter sp. TaxID=1872567 RepID=UPI003D13E667
MKPAPSWPGVSVDLLLRAILAPPDAAVPAWRRWSQGPYLADIGQHELKLLSSLGPRLATLDPETPLRGRIERLVRPFWLQTQMKLRDALPALDVLQGAGIPVIVFKGGAHYAESLVAGSRRLMGDLDILVPSDRSTDALAVLEAEGWEHVDGISLAYLKTADAALRRGNLRKGRFGEIDFHLTPFHHSRRSPALDARLWQRAVPATLAGRAILVPGTTDSLVITLAHGAMGRGGGWALDAAARAERQAIDWDDLVKTAREHALVLACMAGLGYLRQELGVAVPAEVIHALAASPVSLGEHLKYRSYVRDWESRTLLDRVTDRAANWLLRRDGFAPVVDSRPIGAGMPVRRLLSRRRPVELARMQVGLRQEIEMGVPAGRRNCVLKIRAEAPSEKRWLFVEVFADGRSVARLGCPWGGQGGGSARTRAKERIFRFRWPTDSSASVRLILISRPSDYMSPDLSAEERRQTGPMPFSVTGAWWL